jgi:hypothetical protein
MNTHVGLAVAAEQNGTKVVPRVGGIVGYF